MTYDSDVTILEGKDPIETLFASDIAAVARLFRQLEVHKHDGADGDGAAIPGGVLYATMTDVAVSGETTVMSYVIPQNELGANDMLEIAAFANIGAGVRYWRVKLNGTTVLQVSNASSGSLADRYFHAFVRNDDSLAVQRTTGWQMGAPNGITTGTGAIDTSAGDVTLTVTVDGAGTFYHGFIRGYYLPGLPS